MGNKTTLIAGSKKIKTINDSDTKRNRVQELRDAQKATQEADTTQETTTRNRVQELRAAQKAAGGTALAGANSGAPTASEQEKAVAAEAAGNDRTATKLGGSTGDRQSQTEQQTVTDRIGHTVKGAGASYLSDLLAAAGAAWQGSVSNNPANRAVELLMQKADEETAGSALIKTALEREADNNQRQLAAAEQVRELGRDLSEYSQKELETAKSGLGAVGTTLVDVGAAGAQMLGDIGIGAALGVGMMPAMVVRSFGGGAEQAYQAGADLTGQLRKGIGSGAVSYAAESISNIALKGLKVVNPGIADDVLEQGISKLASKLATTPKGAAALETIATLFAAGGGEAFEEWVEAFLDPYVTRLSYDKNASTIFEDPGLMSEALYNALIGGILGGIGGGVDVALNTALNGDSAGNVAQSYRDYQSQYTDEAVNKAYEALKENGMFSQQGRKALQEATAKVDSYLGGRMPVYAAESPSELAEQETEETVTRVEKPAQAEVPAPAMPAAGQADPLTEALAGGKRLERGDLTREMVQAWGSREDVGYDAAGRVYQMDPEQHISQRTVDNVSSRKVNAFQFDHPELQRFYKQAAQELVKDASLSLDTGKSARVERTMQGKKYIQEIVESRSLRSAMDLGLSRSDIIKAAEDLIADHGQENNAAAKRLEMVLDEMLTEGFTTVEGVSFEPNQEYIAAKAKIPGNVETVREELPIWDIEERAVQAAYEAGKANVPVEAVQLEGEAQIDAYTAGRQEYVLSMKEPKAVEKAVGEEYTGANESQKTAPVGVSEEEADALIAYKSSESYKINAALRAGDELNEQQETLVKNLDSALDKMPNHSGKVYRNITFDGVGDQEAFDEFMAGVETGFMTFDGYISTSTEEDGYPIEGPFTVHMVIEGKTGKNTEGFGNNFESEVLFKRGMEVSVDRVEYDADGTPTIYMTEDVEYGQAGAGETLRGDHRGEQNRQPERDSVSRVPEVQEVDKENKDLQYVSGDDSVGNLLGREELRGDAERVKEIDQMVDRAAAPSHEDQWTADRVGDQDKTPMRLSEIIEKIRHDFGINITTGHIRGTGVRGQYNRRDKGIRSKIVNDLPTVAHELGHHLDNVYKLTEKLDSGMESELENGLEAGMKAAYSSDKWVTEGLAEYLRKFLQNRETAAIDYPTFTKHFLSSISSKDAALIEQLADEVNAYYALDADTATSSIRFREEGAADARTYGEKIRDKMSVLYQAWMDGNHGIKEFDRATGSNTYKLATNAAYSDAMAGQIITGDLTNANGQYVAAGLKTALHGLNLSDKKEYRLFGEYLLVKHGPERLAEGMRIFADDRKNSSTFMQNRQAELEQQYPQFAEISDRLYEFQKQFLQTWGVETGLVSSDAAKEWADRWQFYVPLNRAVSADKRGIGAKRGFANQDSTIKKARGSGLDVVHPVDNIVANIVKMVNAGVRNNVMRSITDAAENMGGNALFLEKVPVPLVKRSFDMTGVKEDLSEQLHNSGMDAASLDTADQIVANLDDILYQYGKGKAHGDVITVMKDGGQEFWKINDPQLLASVTNMAPKKMEGVLDAYAVVSRFMTSNITGNNVIWSIFSNFPRDMQTFFVYSKDRNPVKVFASMGSAYINKVKGDNADPLYKEFLAMGGGKTSAYTADRDLAKKARKSLSDKKFSANPLDWLAFVGDAVELGPRYATYKLMRQAGMNPQEAFYEAMDITINFRRGGTVGRELNKIIPFFNAGVQGLDKFGRWISASDVPAKDRKKVVCSRTVTYVTVSAALAATVYALNNYDDEAEEDYEQLSNFTKNSYWNFPLGDGKYFSIPKPQNLGVLSSFFETCMEYGIGENDHAFDEFYSYAADNCLPSVVSDVAQGDFYGAIGSLGIVGVGSYMMANRDFLGRPIVSSGLQNLEAKDQYTNRTSKIAKAVGEAFNVSPQMVDYFFNSVLGGWWKYQKALFPVGNENVDLTLGVQNSYIKDNQYSTDLVNWMYNQADVSAKAKNSDSSNMDKAITAKMDGNMTTFYSRYYALAKNSAETAASRSTRQTVLDMIREYQKAADLKSTTKAQEAVYAICKKQNSTDLLPAVMQSTIKDGNDVEHTISDVQYVEYQTDYLRLYWEYVEDNLYGKQTDAEKAAVLKAAKTVAKEQATNRALTRIGAKQTDFAEKYKGVSDNDVIAFTAQMDLADEDGGLKQDEVVDILQGMIVDGLSYEDAYTLFHSRYESDKNNPWRQHK